MFVCLFICLEPHGQFFSYLAAVAITGDGCKFRPMLGTQGL
jgi:hypothetical protein